MPEVTICLEMRCRRVKLTCITWEGKFKMTQTFQDALSDEMIFLSIEFYFQKLLSVFFRFWKLLKEQLLKRQ